MKNRILLVFDDYTEGEKWQNLLRKLGFVVEVIRNEVALITQLLSLRPDIVFIMGQGITLNPARAVAKINTQSWFNGRILVFESPLRPINMADLEGYRFDGLMTFKPMTVAERLDLLCEYLDISRDALYQKYLATFGNEADPSVQEKSSSYSSAQTPKGKPYEHQDFYKAFQSPPPSQSNPHSVNLREALRFQALDSKDLEARLKKEILNHNKQPEELIVSKKEFVKALFKNSKNS
jgi:hypothetical protein